MFSRRFEQVQPIETGKGPMDNRAHLAAEIDWLHQAVRAQICMSERAGSAAGDEFAGLYISREEVERYLANPTTGELRPQPAWEEAVRARDALDRQAERPTLAGADLRLPQLAAAFDLNRAQRIALLACVAAELDPRLARLFAYLQNDVGKTRPTFALLARLGTEQPADPEQAWTLFGADSPLIHHCLIEPKIDTADVPLPQREARPGPGIVEFVLGIDGLPAALGPATLVAHPADAIGVLAFHRHHRAIRDALLGCWRAGRRPLAYVNGPDGAGKRLIGEAVAAGLGKGVLRLPLPAVAYERADHVARLLGREARLRDALIVLERADEALRNSAEERRRPMLLEAVLGPLSSHGVLMTGVAPPSDVRHHMAQPSLCFDLPYPTAAERLEVWQVMLPSAAVSALSDELPALAAKFRFTPGQIKRAARAVELSAPHAYAAGRSSCSAVLHARCREEAQRGLHELCQQIVPRYGWGDIVLPADTCSQLQEICSWVKHRVRVYDSWGFGDKLALGKGIAILLSGVSGTGKTMSAEVIATELQLDLFRIDLSRIVSKYIGETEKNLSKIFAHGAMGSCILFFDEADALFGKRTEVKDAHDRYANVEVNYLLAEMDRYDGIILISTNAKGNMDSAFTRRFSHVLEYPLPNERQRELIWRKAFPERTPLAADVDFSFLSQRFNLTGGNIKNIALCSAFMASETGSAVGMDHVIRSVKREFQKLGRVCSKSEFGQYYALVREAGQS